MKVWIQKVKKVLRYILLATAVTVTSTYLYLLIVNLIYTGGAEFRASCGIAFLSFFCYLIGSFLLIYNYKDKLHIKL